MRRFADLPILLTHSNHVFSDEKQTKKMEPYPPLQTLIAAAVLRDAGHHVELCDVALEEPRRKLTQHLERLAPSLVVVCEDDFHFLSKMCLSKNRELAFWMARTAVEHGCEIAAHGADATDHPDLYLEAGFDYVLAGEVEPTLLELVEGRDPADIRGLIFRESKSGRICKNVPRPLQKNLDAIPPAAWDLVDIERYRQAWTRKHGYFSMNLVSSRGCPYRCNWCAKPTYGDSYHVRSPLAVAQEMAYIKQSFAPDHLWFADDIFALSPRWTRDFADAVEELNAAIPFKMQSRCDLMTRETVADLKRAGCCDIWMGAESGSQKILDAMDKGTRVDQILSARENLKRHGIRAGWFLQFGYMGENWNDIQATIQMLRLGKPDDVGVSVSYPLPGTKFYRLVGSSLGQKTNWSESGDLAMMFHGTFSTTLYKALAAAIHMEVRAPWDQSAIEDGWRAVETLRQREQQITGVAV